MTQKGPRVSLKGVKLVLEAREAAGLNPWEMAKAMDKSIQAYQYLERHAKSITCKDLATIKKLTKWSWAKIGEKIEAAADTDN